MPGPPISACETIEEYADWMAGVCAQIDGRASWKITASAYDEHNSTAIFVGIFGGISQYVYTLKFEGNQIVSMCKIWNDAAAAAIAAASTPTEEEEYFESQFLTLVKR
jgi:hypothetical protein